MNSKEKACHLTLIHDEAAAIPAPVFDVKSCVADLILNDTSTVGASLAKLLDRMTCLRILSFKYMNVDTKVLYKSYELLRRIGKLINVRHLKCSLGDLRNLIHLRGDLEIKGLGNVAELCVAKKAQLWTKHDLRGLRLKFDPHEIQQVKLEDKSMYSKLCNHLHT
ncbi:hypothetical protein F3Y22_tig00110430pilonHSYRG00365 [Hibiscus syriacus]|uniref:R13L1/DRL21-like LRR repeat region domain-containing protein n=1 Tax=Hibiscus syriacus TaxID=106335 RepID=A0A6A3AKN0_HIBSY|nr:hypothetical protein F3Y22_tig00110430pilonHSYRG00365 [Hibiscus syriacus]